MRTEILAAILLLTGFSSSGQINMADSTAQVITYWGKGEQQHYQVTTGRTKIKGRDTTVRERSTYDVDITVLDSTAGSYTVQWVYKHITANSKNLLSQKLLTSTKDMKVIFRTNDLGEFTEVVNWKEIRDHMLGVTKIMGQEVKDVPGMDKVIQQLVASYSTKEAIESVSIKDIRQFHTFHGAKYQLGKVLTDNMKVPNLMGTQPFDCDVTVRMDEINEQENYYTVQATQQVNKTQLTNATFDYLVKMAGNLKIEPPKREDLKDLKNETITTSKIHGTGWIVQSKMTTTITSDDQCNIEERTIELM